MRQTRQRLGGALRRTMLLMVAVIGAVSCSTGQASAAVLANINGESGTTVRTQYAGTSNGILYDGGVGYEILEQKPAKYSVPAFPDVNTRHRPLENLRHQIAYAGQRSLIFQGYDIPTSDCDASFCPPDRQEVRLSGPGNASTMNFDEWRFLRFYIKVHPDTTVGPQRAIISQTWQIGSGGNAVRGALGPAFAVMMSNQDASRVNLDFTYRNNPDPSQNAAHTFASTVINKDQWYSFHVQMKAKYDGARGAILVWKNHDSSNLNVTEALNYSAIDDSSWKFHWGYPPEPTIAGGLENAFDVRVGLYRPAPMDNLTFWLDNVRLTDSAASMPGS